MFCLCVWTGPPSNLSLSIGETSVNLTWVSKERQRNVGFFIHYLRGDGTCRIDRMWLRMIEHKLIHWIANQEVAASLPVLLVCASSLSVTEREYKRVCFDLYCIVFCPGKGKWKHSEKVNSSQSFYMLQGLQPGSQYHLRIDLGNKTIWTDKIQTAGTCNRKTAFSYSLYPHLVPNRPFLI